MVSSYHNLVSHPSRLHDRAIFHDETVYPDSNTFNPGRFLTEDGRIDPSVPDPEQRVFGSGRRLVSTVFTEVYTFSPKSRQDMPRSILCNESGIYFECEGSSDLRYFAPGG